MLALFASLAIAATPMADHFAGGFIQLNVSTANEPSSRLNREKWAQVLGSMKKIGMTTVIIQHLAYCDKGVAYDLLRPNEPDDATESILGVADELNMAVIVGLWNIKFSESDFHQTFFDSAKNESLRTLTKFQKNVEYVQHRSFGGWYLPIEPWNFKRDQQRLSLFKDYLSTLSRECKKVADKPVAFSCHFTPDSVRYASATEMGEIYKEMLTGAGIDILMPQDGVGEKGHTSVDCCAYFKAYKEACDAKIKLWAVLECFTLGVDGNRFPTRVDRLAVQFENAQCVADSYMTYDFFHYMNPNKYTWTNGDEIVTLCAGGCAACRTCLYDGYRKLIGLIP